jgi:hypothetical protein
MTQTLPKGQFVWVRSMIEYLRHVKSVLSTNTGGEQITKGLTDKYPDYGARTLAELSGWFTDFMGRRR